MAKKPNRKESNMSNDALAALGLDETDVAPATATVAAEVAAEVEAKASVEREEVDVGEIELGTLDYIPASKRASGGSKYKFDELAAPKTGENGKTNYSFFKVALQPGVDADKLKRSVQSATTQANTQAKAAGQDAYFITRAQNGADGNFAAILVIRTDDRPVKEEASA